MLADSVFETGMVKVTEYVSYNPHAILGKGSSGIVFKGYHSKNEETIAVKIIKRINVNEELVLR